MPTKEKRVSVNLGKQIRIFITQDEHGKHRVAMTKSPKVAKKQRVFTLYWKWWDRLLEVF